MEPLDQFTANQALQLLWILEKENSKYELEFTKGELSHIRLCLIDEWDTLTSPYRRHLVSQDKLDVLSMMSRELPIFT